MRIEFPKNEYYRFILLVLVLIVIFTAGCTNNLTYNQNLPSSTTAIPTTPPEIYVATTPNPNYASPTSTPTDVPVYVLPIPAAGNMKDQNIQIIKKIVEEYHKTHTYNLPDMYACAQMSQDVWDMVETQNINAIIKVGRIDQDISKESDANHAWVLAETSPGEYIAMETTGGYLVCTDPSICAVNNPRYYFGWTYNTPKELQDYLKNPSGCSAGYVPGNDNLCHPACGANTYCTGNDVCVSGQCRGCSSGYILGQDLQCHLACGNSNTYCTGNGVCVNGECRSCNSGYVLGNDNLCHPACGVNTYCTGNGACINGRCI